MPIYVYKCRPCDETTEKLQKHSDKAPECDKCNQAMTKQVARSSFVLNGAGWARDNYGLKH